MIGRYDSTIGRDAPDTRPGAAKHATERQQIRHGFERVGIKHRILALSEALANAVVHGAKADPKKIVECDVMCDETRGLLIVVRDPGPGFNPEQIPSPLVGQNIYSNHGRGIFLINELMDAVEFKNNGKEIHMLKR